MICFFVFSTILVVLCDETFLSVVSSFTAKFTEIFVSDPVSTPDAMMIISNEESISHTNTSRSISMHLDIKLKHRCSQRCCKCRNETKWSEHF
uniref:Secreted protein n=1 Tax=Ascaris lumbricoides TaxID=6252 RepID=A0A0M3IPL6_ASCLU